MLICGAGICRAKEWLLHFLWFMAVYVDPGSGSMVLQILLGGVSGIYVIFRLFKQRILGFFGIRAEASGAADPAQRVAPNKDSLKRQAP